MKLKKLTIQEGNGWDGTPKGQYVGKMEWEGKGGETTVVLDSEVSRALLSFIGPAIIQFSSKAAGEIASNIELAVQEARQSPAIEAGTVQV